jgi:hypothetical protein
MARLTLSGRKYMTSASPFGVPSSLRYNLILGFPVSISSEITPYFENTSMISLSDVSSGRLVT